MATFTTRPEPVKRKSAETAETKLKKQPKAVKAETKSEVKDGQ